MFDFTDLKAAFRQIVPNLFSTILNWSVGLLIILLFCFLVLLVKSYFGVYIMMAAAIVILIMIYLGIEIFWSLSSLQQMKKAKRREVL